jgi:non-ribosomal peptide synthase protein (TIGR01720 family)
MVSAGQLRLTLSSPLTVALLSTVPAAFHAGIDDVLLTGLVVAVAAWRRQQHGSHAGAVIVNLEAHGRESLDSGLDVSHTVGWFTSLYPVALDLGPLDVGEALAGGAAIGEVLKRVKEQLRAIPGGGLGYGQLRYLHADAGRQLASHADVQLGFNYLGRVRSGERADWALAPELITVGVDPGLPLAYLIDVNAVTFDDPGGSQLSAIWSWASRHLKEREVRALADLWQRALEALWHHVARGGGGHTPSDFPLVTLTPAEVEWLEAQCPDLQDVLPLTPLQEGLVFHALYDETAPDVYTVQLVVALEGVLQPERLRSAATTLLHRHANLRASIQHEGLARPVQVIARDLEVPWRTIDLLTLSGEEQHRRQLDILHADRMQRFNLAEPPLLRFTLLRLRAEHHLLVFTSHHVLLDGWSTPVLFQELLTL